MNTKTKLTPEQFEEQFEGALSDIGSSMQVIYKYLKAVEDKIQELEILVDNN